MGLLLCLLFVSACINNAPASSAQTPAAQGVSTQSPGSADAVVLAMLNNIKANGFDANAAINTGLGGLWINWRFDTNPLQTNLNGSGVPDGSAVNPPRHDPLTDLRYLHALLLYRSLHPTDTQFDSEITRYTAIVKLEYAHPQDQRGWLYDEFIGLFQLSHDSFYQQAAISLATYFDTQLYQPAIGAIYKTSGSDPQGYYRVDLALEAGCALIQAGTSFNQPGWVTDGQRVVQFVYAHAYVPTYHVFLFQMDDVLLSDGTVNPDEPIFRGNHLTGSPSSHCDSEHDRT